MLHVKIVYIIGTNSAIIVACIHYTWQHHYDKLCRLGPEQRYFTGAIGFTVPCCDQATHCFFKRAILRDENRYFMGAISCMVPHCDGAIRCFFKWTIDRDEGRNFQWCGRGKLCHWWNLQDGHLIHSLKSADAVHRENDGHGHSKEVVRVASLAISSQFGEGCVLCKQVVDGNSLLICDL